MLCSTLCKLALLASLTALLPAESRDLQAGTPSSSSEADAAHKVLVMDGGAGPCSLDLTVTSDGKPVYAAVIKVKIAYGFVGARRLELQAATNVDGKVKFTGIPEKVRRPPLVFQGSKDKQVGSVSFDPQDECHAQHDMALQEARAEDDKP